jgi:hypothetical protein
MDGISAEWDDAPPPVENHLESVMDDQPSYVCARCTANRIAGVMLPSAFDVALTSTMPQALLSALANCAACLAQDERTIDRAHVEAVHARFGRSALPLEPWLARRAVAARPELARASLLVADVDATLVSPVETWERRLEALTHAHVPGVVLAQTRQSLEAARALDVRLEWDRVAPWPAEDLFPGTVAFGEVARVMAEQVLPAFLGRRDAAPLLSAIDGAAAALVLDSVTLACRHRLQAEVEVERKTDARRARGLELAVRFLDELGHSQRLTNQDTLVDDCHGALASVGLGDEAAAVYRCWLEAAVPRAWRRVGGQYSQVSPRYVDETEL